MTVRAAGFDEGDKPKDWQTAFARRGIAVPRDCLRAGAPRPHVDASCAIPKTSRHPGRPAHR